MEFLIPVVAALIGIIGVIMSVITNTRWKFLAGGLIGLLWVGIMGLKIYHNNGDKRLKNDLAIHVQQQKKHANEIQGLKDDHAKQARLMDTVVNLVGILRDMLNKSDASGIASIKDKATTVLQRVNTPKALSIAKKFEASRVKKVRDHRRVQ